MLYNILLSISEIIFSKRYILFYIVQCSYIEIFLINIYIFFIKYNKRALYFSDIQAQFIIKFVLRSFFAYMLHIFFLKFEFIKNLRDI